jgi:hypothetical protein
MQLFYKMNFLVAAKGEARARAGSSVVVKIGKIFSRKSIKSDGNISFEF